ncbi:MAG: rRNA adenine N(6)-methyltransferase family protein [Firmicutes bacterium]|nr:rRNA adenine N(6)-methyltransferase family protein [Bacillota bacterium]
MSKCKSDAAPVWAGQNFLTGYQTVRRLLDKTTIGPGDRVIEIGPGKGHITRQLAPRCASLWAVEPDARLCAALRARFSDAGNVRLVQGDFLRYALPARGAYKVFANLPFGLTTQMILRLAGAANPPADAWLIMEHGAAMRFMGQPHESARSLTLKPQFALHLAAHLPREAFHPMPRVDAAMLHLHRRPVPDLPRGQMDAYERFVRYALARGFKGLLTRGQISRALSLEGHENHPSAELLYVQWLCLFRCYAGLSRV